MRLSLILLICSIGILFSFINFNAYAISSTIITPNSSACQYEGPYEGIITVRALANNPAETMKIMVGIDN